jgi:hypothetical protein
MSTSPPEGTADEVAVEPSPPAAAVERNGFDLGQLDAPLPEDGWVCEAWTMRPGGMAAGAHLQIRRRYWSRTSRWVRVPQGVTRRAK